MKKIFTMLLATCALIACSDDKELDQATETKSAAFTVDVSTFDDSNFGVYEGTFTTIDSENRGILDLTINQDGVSRASIELSNGPEIKFSSTATVIEGEGIENMLFTSEQGTFKFSVGRDGSNPIISEVTFGGVSGIVKVAKETSRAPVNPIAGAYYCGDCGTHPVLGGGAAQTFNVLFVGDGSADDTATTTILLGANDYGSDATNNSQSGCAAAGGVTNCSFTGTSATVVGGAAISYSGTHTYDNVADCSQLNGTWSFASGAFGTLTGTFFSDTQCAAPGNDLCGDATPIACGDTLGWTTAAATDTDEPAACGTSESAAGGVWFAYSRSIGNDQDVTIALCGSTFDTKIFLYTGACGALTCELGNDDSCGLQSSVTFNEADLTGDIYVYATGFFDSTGSGVISVTCADPPPPPACDPGSFGGFGSTGPVDDASCPVDNPFVYTEATTGTIGTDTAIDKVTLNIDHTWNGDLEIKLLAPDGTTSLDLSIGNGGASDNYTDTVFQDGGGDITAATGPFTGTFEPQGGPFATAFAGQSVAGDWTLLVCDSATGDTGTVNDFLMCFTSLTGPAPAGEIGVTQNLTPEMVAEKQRINATQKEAFLRRKNEQ